jgi:hypothetical protein
MTPRETLDRCLAALAGDDPDTVVELLDPADYPRWRERQLFHLALDLADELTASPESAEAQVRLHAITSSELPLLLSQYGSRPLSELEGAPTLAEVEKWEPRKFLRAVIGAALRRARTRGDQPTVSPTVVAEASEGPDLAHLLVRDSARPGSAEVEVFTLRRVDGRWRLCLGNALDLVIHF